MAADATASHSPDAIFAAVYTPYCVTACADIQRQEKKVTVYMGVPTMYSYLLSKHDSYSQAEQEEAQ